MVKNPPAIQVNAGARSLGQEDPVEKEIFLANHPVFLPGKSPWTGGA